MDGERTNERDVLRLTLPAEPSALGAVRGELGRFLDRNRIPDEVFYDALLVAHELAANAVRHGSEPGDEVELRAEIRGPRLRLVVSDPARHDSAPLALAPDAAAEGGRGLQIVGRLADWTDERVDGRRQVRAELALR